MAEQRATVPARTAHRRWLVLALVLGSLMVSVLVPAIAAAGMFAAAILVGLTADRLVQIFSSDPAVIDVGEVYLQVTAWNFVASGVIFVTSSTFQAMGNTVPSLITSGLRIVLIAIPVLLLRNAPGFSLLWIWYISVGGIFLQLLMNLLLLRREFRLRLAFEGDVDTPKSESAAVRA